MIAFQVQDMSCSHCVNSLDAALRGADGQARIHIDLSRRLVLVESDHADAQALGQAITAAGYTPVPVPPPVDSLPAATAARTCCGHCH